ncbi:BaiN/RdsA family NAD(P)/FAD-dependent oxidoreductase [Cellulosilyticum ruminicola]|uniref:NAD(P)/FAD-dependent oxidoreductase n=1 Tax=Cellulosilyticum ruminicola TaxID=425254 RepID=UPI0006D13F86|nr:NAD(P)/FAD-dependent oxidoreductase [Cellulosilyticum ruminicola]
MNDIIIIGGGASGMMAAITAAREGKSVLILERLNRIGKKILVTGNGRCNVSNTNLKPEHFHSRSQKAIFGPIEAFDYGKTEAFFKELGIEPLIEGTKVYPRSEQANSVLDVLRMELEELEVDVLTEVKVVGLKNKKSVWEVEAESGEVYMAEKVIMATGGLANASLGCDGLGYEILKKLGHTVIPTYPILVHALSSSPYCKMMKGTKVKAVASAYVNGKCEREEFGEVLFTEDGLSGPAIFQISRNISCAHIQKKKAMVTLDLVPEQSYDEVVAMIYERIAAKPERSIELLLMGFLNKRVIVPVLKCADINSIHRNCDTLEYEEVEHLVKVLKGFPFETQGTRGYKYAQVTAGGISVDEIDLETMASLKAPHLYVTGEILDVDGDCGGYNLQWAWATGYIAGINCSK